MIIQSSAVTMNSQRNYSSISAMSGLIGSRFLGSLSHSAASSTNKTQKKDSENDQKQQHLTNSDEDLMARFSQSRSIRAAGLENGRSLRSMHKIRRQSIGFMLHQLFWGNRYTSGSMNPVSALLSDYSKNRMYQPFTSQKYFEAEQTSFATEGTVVTASGKEISFNVEVEMSRTFYEETSAVIDLGAVKLTDPLVINLDTEAASVSDQKFYFDLDADGHQELISRLGAGSGFLALDKNGDGIINDGSELFGTASGNGFADLAKYDQDGNGWIDEADEIFDKLLIWQKDENGKDVLRGLGAAGVGAIYLGNISTQFSLNSAADNKTNAVVRQTGAFLYENGTAGTMQQIDLAQ